MIGSKQIVFFGNNATATAGAITLTESTASATFGGLQLGKSQWANMNVLLNVKSLTGSGTIIASVQERISDVGFVETAKSGTISATGTYWLNHQPANTVQVGSTQWGGFGALGNGYDKQIVFTNSSLATVSVDVYFAFFQD